MVEGDDELVFFEALGDDDVMLVVGVRGNADPAALADGVAVQTFVLAENFPRKVHDGAGLFGNVLPEKFVDADFSDEADALAVFARGVGQPRFRGDGAQFPFEQMPDGEERAARLLLTQQREKIALILAGIVPAENVRRAVRVHAFPRVMSRGDEVEAVGEGFSGEHAEFHFAVAENVRIRRDAASVSVHEIRDDVFAVVFDQIDDAERDVELFRDGARVRDVVLPWAFAEKFSAFLVHPRAHVGGAHVVPFALQQKRGDGAVDASGKRYKNLCHSFFF